MDVLVKPLNRLLRVAPGANLLEALRAAGVPLSHSCRAGRCGTCRCQLIEGDVLESGREQQRPLDGTGNFVFACQTYVTGHCTIEIPDDDDGVVLPARIVSATVAGVESLTHDVTRLLLTSSKRLEHLPGQHAHLEFSPGWVRPYSMAGLCTDDVMEFHVRRLPGGRASGHVAQTLRPGDRVKVSGPLGSAYLRRKHTGPVLCVVEGTGLAPVLAILRGAVAAQARQPIMVYVGARSAKDLYGLGALETLREQHPALTVHVVVASRGAAPSYRCGLVTQAIEQDFRDLSGWQAHVFGSPPMVEAVTFLARRKGLPAQHIHAEAFYTQDS